MRRNAWLFGVVLLAACDSVLESVRQEEKWKEQQIHDYQFVYRELCFCGFTGPNPALVTVHNDQVVKVENPISSISGGVPTNGYPTVDSLFARIASAKVRGAATVEVSYDDRYAFPKSIFIDDETNTADDEVTYKIENFVTLSPSLEKVLSERH